MLSVTEVYFTVQEWERARLNRRFLLRIGEEEVELNRESWSDGTGVLVIQSSKVQDIEFTTWSQRVKTGD